MSEYAIATNDFVISLPTGTTLPAVGLGKNGWGGNWLGDLSKLIAGEAWRLAIPDKHGRGARLPFASPPEESVRDNPTAIEPAIDLMARAQQYVLQEISSQVEQLNTRGTSAAREDRAA